MTPEKAAAGGPRRVLVVEDEALIAMLVESLLEERGFAIIGPASRIAPALTLAERETFDTAVLDVNLAGEPIFPVADVLARRAIPIVFLTGYGRLGVPDRYRDYAVVEKPIDADKLLAAVDAALGVASRPP